MIVNSWQQFLVTEIGHNEQVGVACGVVHGHHHSPRIDDVIDEEHFTMGVDCGAKIGQR